MFVRQLDFAFCYRLNILLGYKYIVMEYSVFYENCPRKQNPPTSFFRPIFLHNLSSNFSWSKYILKSNSSK